jgi:Calcium-activated chloride channel
MFAVAFPLAPLLAVARNVMEFCIDSWKITETRRPKYTERSGIGSWYAVLELLSLAAVGTNCMLLGLGNPKVSVSAADHCNCYC